MKCKKFIRIIILDIIQPIYCRQYNSAETKLLI